MKRAANFLFGFFVMFIPLFGRYTQKELLKLIQPYGFLVLAMLTDVEIAYLTVWIPWVSIQELLL